MIDADELPAVNTIATANGREVEIVSWVPLRQIEDAPTVEAIPIEWITQYREKLTAELETDGMETAEGLLVFLGGGLIGIERMLKEWEKENETD